MQLEVKKTHERDQMTYVEGARGWVNASINCTRPCTESLLENMRSSDILNESTTSKVVEERKRASLEASETPRPTSQH